MIMNSFFEECRSQVMLYRNDSPKVWCRVLWSFLKTEIKLWFTYIDFELKVNHANAESFNAPVSDVFEDAIERLGRLYRCNVNDVHYAVGEGYSSKTVRLYR